MSVKLCILATAVARQVRSQSEGVSAAVAASEEVSVAVAAEARSVRAEAHADAAQVQALYAQAKQSLALAAEASTGYPPRLNQFLGRDYYAYMVSYVIGEMVGHTVYHTSMAFCPATDARRTHYEGYAARCAGQFFDSQCWLAEKKGQMHLVDHHVSARERHAHEDPRAAPRRHCIELGYGVKAGAGVEVVDTPWQYGEDLDPDFYALGPVSGQQIDAAIAFTQTCGHNGRKLDFNLGTYDMIGHNCHHHVDAMLGYLQLPRWSTTHSVPDHFMPEDPDHNPVRSAIVHRFMPPAPMADITSAACQGRDQEWAARDRFCFGDLFCGGRESR